MDSDSEGNLVVDDGGTEVDDSICPKCQQTTYVGETINCEKCQYWFHFECVGVTHNDPWVKNEDVPYFCKDCKGKTKKPAKKASSTPKSKKSKKEQQSPPIKLKISLGKKKSRSSIELSPPRQIPNKRKSVTESPSMNLNEDSPSELTSPSGAKRRKRQKSEDEEEKWLNAVESGNLHNVDAELKSIRDPKLMTARQRAMVDRKNNDDYNDEESGHMSLSYKNTKKKSTSYVDEEENQRIKAMKVAKRKEIEMEKREQDRIKTVERLLNKKESTTLKTSLKSTSSVSASSTSNEPKIIYVQNLNGPFLTFPASMELPIEAKKPIKPPMKIHCSVANCKNVKKYNCSKTGKPLCSLACYKKNLLISSH